MRAALSGVIVGLFVLVAGVVGFPQAEAQRPAGQSAAASSPDLVALSFDAGEGRQQITVVDPRQRVLAVYHIDRATGALALKSVRSLQWDLQIEDYNSASPAPRDIRALKEQQR